MNDTNIHKNIKDAFALLENAMLDDKQIAEIMRRAANPGRSINRALLFAAATAPLIAAAAALALCIFFSQAGGYNSEPHGHIPDNIGTIVVESSNREKLVIRNGELQIISTIDWEWENSTRAAISAIKASKYFRDPGEDPASALSGLSADGISSEPRAQQADY